MFAGVRSGRGRKLGFGVLAVAVAAIAGLSVWNIARAAGDITIAPNSGPTAGGDTIVISGVDSDLNPSLPIEYTPVEFLKFNNAQYIDTGIDSMNDPKLVVDYASDTTGLTGWSMIAGVRNGPCAPCTNGLGIGVLTTDSTVRGIYNAAGTNANASTNSLATNNGNRRMAEIGYQGATVTAKIDSSTILVQQTIPTAAANFSIGQIANAGVPLASSYF